MVSPFGVITLSLLLVLITASSGAGIDYFVGGGGRNGWTINPAMPLSFQINDALEFRCDKDVDAVLRVSQGHYGACNTTHPLLRLDGGHPRFVFRVSDFYYFISADARRCRDDGERIAIFVLHRHNNTPSPPRSAPTSSLPPVTGNAPSPLPLPPPPSPKLASTSSAPKPASSPPPVPTPAQSVLPPSSRPPYPSSAGNASSPSLPPLTTAPVPGTKNRTGTGPPSTPSSAIALRAGVLAACLLVGASAASLMLSIDRLHAF